MQVDAPLYCELEIVERKKDRPLAQLPSLARYINLHPELRQSESVLSTRVKHFIIRALSLRLHILFFHLGLDRSS